MGAILLTNELRAEYERLFAEAEIPEGREPLVAKVAQTILDNWPRYETVAASIRIPPHPIALIHAMESGCDFTRHLHNGDPLNARTTHVPAGRPTTGEPPYTWEASAMDALRFHKLDQWADWSIAGLCYVLERYNGWGYRKYHPNVKSPYLWSFTSIYTSGKYVADGKWSEVSVSQQVGAMALLVEITKHGHPYPIAKEVEDAKASPQLVPAQAQSSSPVLPAQGLPDVPGDGTTMGDAVRTDLPDVARLTAILKALAKSKTIYGVLGMLGLQLLGVNTWDVAIRIGGQIYTIPDLSPYFSTALASLAVWGRITAKPVKGGSNA